MRRIALVLFLPFFLAACDSAGTDHASSTATTASARQEKVNVCHRTRSETNPWVLVNVAAPAAAHHLANHNGAPDDRDYLASDPNSPLDVNCNVREIEGSGRIIITLIESDTDLQASDLRLFMGTNPGPSQTPGGGTFLFMNSDPAGTQRIIENVPANTDLHFGFFVRNLFNANTSPAGTRDAWFFSGPASGNFDNQVHALFTPSPDPSYPGEMSYLLGFEDLCLASANTPSVCNGTYGSEIPVYADFDWNDAVFRVTIVD